MPHVLLYQKVSNTIKEDILSGEYPVGSYLPTEIQLEEIFDVSKITVRKAISILSREGYVEKRSGKGTKVISNRLFNNMSKASSFSSILEEDHALKKKLHRFEKVNLKKADELYTVFGSKASKMTRVYYLDGEPYIYFNHYFPYIEIDEETALKQIEEESIYNWLSNLGHGVAAFEDSFEIVEVKEKIVNFLNLDDNNMLLRIRKSKDADDQIIEVSYGYYNSKVHPYIIKYEV